MTDVYWGMLIANISAEISENEFKIGMYLKLSFGVPIPLLKESASYLAYNDERTENAIKAVEGSIEESRPIWSARLQPA